MTEDLQFSNYIMANMHLSTLKKQKQNTSFQQLDLNGLKGNIKKILSLIF